MSLRLVVDMNMSIEWVGALEAHGWRAVHWSTVGDPLAEDREIMSWALAEEYAVFTHDLYFGTALALTHASGSSVLQVRGTGVLPDDIGALMFAALSSMKRHLLRAPLLWWTRIRRVFGCSHCKKPAQWSTISELAAYDVSTSATVD